jgi:hypothetical protein
MKLQLEQQLTRRTWVRRRKGVVEVLRVLKNIMVMKNTVDGCRSVERTRKWEIRDRQFGKVGVEEVG